MFRTRIRELREAAGYKSQQAFANAFGVAQSTVGGWEAGKREPNYDTTLKLAKFFHVSLDYLLGKSNFRNAHEMIDYWGVIGSDFEGHFDFGKLVQQEREKQGIPLADMAAELGITVQDAADCEDGALPITRELADKMAAFLGTDVSQMLFDNDLYPEEVPEEYHDRVAEWERLCKVADQEAQAEIYPILPSKQQLSNNVTPIDFSKYRQIPILGRISAGLPIYAEEHIEGYSLTDLNGGAEYFALRVQGDSMNAIGINDGYIIIVRRQEEVENGEIAVVMVGDEDATIKRFYATAGIVTLLPQSTNPDHKPQIYDTKTTNIKVLGKVKKVEFSI